MARQGDTVTYRDLEGNSYPAEVVEVLNPPTLLRLKFGPEGFEKVIGPVEQAASPNAVNTWSEHGESRPAEVEPSPAPAEAGGTLNTQNTP